MKDYQHVHIDSDKISDSQTNPSNYYNHNQNGYSKLTSELQYIDNISVPDPSKSDFAQIIEFGFYDMNSNFVSGSIIVSDENGNLEMASPGHMIISTGTSKRLFISSNTQVLDFIFLFNLFSLMVPLFLMEI